MKASLFDLKVDNSTSIISSSKIISSHWIADCLITWFSVWELFSAIQVSSSLKWILLVLHLLCTNTRKAIISHMVINFCACPQSVSSGAQPHHSLTARPQTWYQYLAAFFLAWASEWTVTTRSRWSQLVRGISFEWFVPCRDWLHTDERWRVESR